MAKSHGAKEQKRAAKKKAKRQAKRAIIIRRSSSDPTIRLQGVAKWPLVRCLIGTAIGTKGIGHALIARREPAGGLVSALLLVDVYCLGVKDAFWRTGTSAELDEFVKKMEEVDELREVEPAYFAKLILGAVEYADLYGFSPHPGFQHASKLLDGIDPASCPTEFTYGKDGRPFYIQGPNESSAEAEAIMFAMQKVGGDFMGMLPGDDNHDDEYDDELTEFDEQIDQIESADQPRALEGPR
jgi:hypothetical protein